ncbi:MAG TPA: metabolite traffic protein EboE [Vicinamibacteria bacterium]
MNIGGARPSHLTYCTNIHPGETWPEVRRNLERHVLRVKAIVAPDRAFGVGLRLSAEAARSLGEPATLAELKSFLSLNDLYVFTINGFPYGPFHGTRVKEDVYRPDWLEEERLHYTDALSWILAALLPAGLLGSISTVPGCFKPRAAHQGSTAAMADRLLRHVSTLVGLERGTGKRIALALEPEPYCVLETVAETVAFFESHLFGRSAIAKLASLSGLGASAAEGALHRHLGVCFDSCHAAVEFEDPQAAVLALRGAGIAIHKIQVSAGLLVDPPSAENKVALASFAEDVYLHQVVSRRGVELRRYPDIAPALADPAAANDDEWRIHFHVPLFREELGAFRNTQGFLRELLALQTRDGLTSHLEVETYTWHVLPPEYRAADVAEDVARELRWTLEALAVPPHPPSQ